MFPNVTDLEQPAFNPADRLFYVSVLSSGRNPGGSICTLDIAALSIACTYPLPDCVPAGIVFWPKNHLFIGCSESQITDYGYSASYIMAVSTGNVILNISGLTGIDQVAYDSAANLFYASAYQNLGTADTPLPQIAVVNASSGTLIQTLPTDNVTAHSVAVDGRTGLMLVPIKNQGIVAYSLKAGMMSSGRLPTNGMITSGAMKGTIEVLMASIAIGIAGLVML